MPKWFEKILKYNPAEKSLKAPFAIYLDLECLLKKELTKTIMNNLAKTITKNLTQRKKLSMSLQAGQCLQGVYLIKLIITEEKIVLKKTIQEYAMKIMNYEKKK